MIKISKCHLERVSFLLEVSLGFLPRREKISQDLRKEARSHATLHKVVPTEMTRVKRSTNLIQSMLRGRFQGRWRCTWEF